MLNDLGTWLGELASTFGSRRALRDEQRELSYDQLDTVATAWAAQLVDRGFGPGTHIGLLAPNSCAWFAAAGGVWRSGATLVPLSTFATDRELRELAEHADLDAVIVQPRFAQRDLAAAAGAAVESLQRPCTVIPLADPLSRLPFAAPMVSGSDIACILYTSGTTGRPKGVRLTHAGILATVAPTAECGGLTPGDCMLSSLPLFWVAGLVIRALPTLHSGAALLLMETFTAEAALTILRRDNVTALHLRPPQVGQLVQADGFRAQMLAAVRRGGGRSEWFLPHLAAAQLITGYGMTEMSGYVTALRWDDAAEARATALGAPLPGVEMRIVHADGSHCDAGESGEIHVRGPGLYAGYHKEPRQKGLTADGWFATGDLGSLDAAGTFRFAGRSKDLLRVKGINVSPVEVEEVLSAHRDVEAVYVVGLPPDSLDQEVVALIIPRAVPPEVDELRELARMNLSSYKRPRDYLFIGRSDVVLGATSKPQRDALAKLATGRRGRSERSERSNRSD